MKNLLFIFICCIFASFSVAADLKTIDAEIYFKDNPSWERESILKFIVGQFKDRQVSQKELDLYWNNKKLREELKLARFQIVNQKLYVESFDITRPYFITLTLYLQRLVQEYKISDLDMLFHIGDEIENKSNYKGVENLNSFMMSKNLNSPLERDKFLFSDSYMLSKNWRHLIEKIRLANKNYPWENKEEKIFWRGYLSRVVKGTYQLADFDKTVRLKIIFLSKLYPDAIDARLTGGVGKNYSQSSKDLDMILKLTFNNNYQATSERKHLKYKYLISVDGNTCAWMRVPWIMLSNSLLLKQETSKIEWFYPALKAFYNYVPLREDLSDIFIKYDWLKNNDDKVKIISKNATNFIENNLQPEDIDKQTVITLNEYAKIQKDKNLNITLQKAEDVFSFTALLTTLYKKLEEKIIGWF
jgi:hypothetical protein